MVPLLVVATVFMFTSWLVTLSLVFVTRDSSHLLSLALWTFNVTYYARWTYAAHASKKEPPPEQA